MRSAQIIALLALLPSAPTEAAELRLGGEISHEYNSEVVFEADDLITTVRPTIGLNHEGRQFTFAATYRPGYEIHHKESDLSDFLHTIDVRTTYAPDARTQFFLDERYVVIPNPFLLADTDDPGNDFELGTGETKSNVVTLGFTRTLGRRFLVNSEFSHFMFDREEGTDTESITANAGLSYDWSESHRVGVSFRFRNTESMFDGVTTSDVDTYELLATWRWIVNARTTLSVAIGPARVESDVPEIDRDGLLVSRQFPIDPDTREFLDSRTCDTLDLGGVPTPFNSGCDTFPAPFSDDVVFNRSVLLAFDPNTDFGSPSDATTNVFGNISLVRTFRRGSARLNWSRTDSQTQQIGGGSTSIDTVSLTLDWEFNERNRIRVSGRFSRREAIGDSLRIVTLLGPPFGRANATTFVARNVSPAIGITTLRDSQTNRQDTYDLSARFSRDITRRLTAYFEARYRDQSRESSVETTSDGFDRYRVRVGLEVTFDPIQLDRIWGAMQ